MVSENSGKKFIRCNHSVGLNQFHFEWCPKYRFECMKKEWINKGVESCIRQAARENRIAIHEMAVGFDHVHVFASIPFTMSPAEALGKMKGRSAYLIFRMFQGFRKRYPKGHFWAPGKFGRSVSNITSGTVKTYIENQQFEKLNETIEMIDDEPRQLNLTDFC